MNIAIVNTEYPPLSGKGNGGITTYTITLSKLLSEMGHTVYLLSREGFKYEEPFLDRVKPYFFGFKKNKNLLIRFLEKFSDGKLRWEKGVSRGLSLLLREIISKNKIDIIEIPEYGGLGYFFKKDINIPYAVTFHTPSKLIDLLNNVKPTKTNVGIYKMEKVTIKNGSAFKSPSMAMKKWCSEHYGIDSCQISVIPNPFIAEPFLKLQKEKGENPYFNLLFVGRLETRKGASVLLDNINDILSISPKIHLIIAGETNIEGCSNYRKIFIEKIQPESKEQLIFTGAISREELIKLYKDASLVILPSLFENFPYVMLEAMASSLPVIVSSKGGMGEVIVDGVNGFTFDPSNRGEFIEKIKRVFFNQDLALQLGINAKKTIENDLNSYKIVQKHLNFYKSVIEKRVKVC